MTSSRRCEETGCSGILSSVLGTFCLSWGLLQLLLAVVVVTFSARKPPKSSRPLESQISDGLLSNSCGLSSGSRSLAGVLSTASVIVQKSWIVYRTTSRQQKMIFFLTSFGSAYNIHMLYLRGLWNLYSTRSVPTCSNSLYKCEKQPLSGHKWFLFIASDGLHYPHTDFNQEKVSA